MSIRKTKKKKKILEGSKPNANAIILFWNVDVLFTLSSYFWLTQEFPVMTMYFLYQQNHGFGVAGLFKTISDTSVLRRQTQTQSWPTDPASSMGLHSYPAKSLPGGNPQWENPLVPGNLVSLASSSSFILGPRHYLSPRTFGSQK